MLVYFENHPYPENKIKPYLDGAIPVVNEDGGYKCKYIGYLFVSNKKYTGPVFLLPKPFLQKEKNRPNGEMTLLGYQGLYPKDIFNTEDENNPLVSNDMETFLPELSLWLYRAMSRYLEEVNKEDDEEAKKDLIYLTPQNGYRDRDFLSTAVRLMDFLADHRNLFTQISIINHSGKAAVDWHKTVEKDPFFHKGKPYYLELQVKDKTINIDEELIVIYYSVLKYLRDKFKFKIELGDVPYDLMGVWEIQNYLDTGLGKKRLSDIRGKYFRDDLKYLWSLLDSFFNFNTTSDDKAPRKEALVVKNFEKVFERMVDKLIGDSNELSALKNQPDGKLIDHIYRDKSLIGTDTEIYYIGDSKYYGDNHAVSGVPLYKQFTYAKNAIQYNIEHINLQGLEKLGKLRYRDEETEGYNVTPNFFIRPKIEPGNLRCDEPSLKWSGTKFDPNIQFKDRLFDRDTLLLREYNINLLFLIAAYGTYEDWSKTLREDIRKDMLDFLNMSYRFFKITPIDIPIYSQNGQVGSIPFLNYHHNRLRGKVYKTSDSSDEIIIAFERGTETGEKDLADAKDHLSSSVEGNTLGPEVKLKA